MLHMNTCQGAGIREEKAIPLSSRSLESSYCPVLGKRK